jgi:predicted DNA-binding protein YlxM (UPF0122 family)
MGEEYNAIVPVADEEMQEQSIKLLKPKQQRFVHMYLSGKYKTTEIIDILQVSPVTVHNWLKNPQIKSIIDEYQQAEMEIVQHNLKALTMKALNKMNDLLESPVDGIAFQAAKDLLDRTGFKPSTKQDVKVEIYNYEQQIKQLVGDDIELLEDTEYEVESD